jgi:hypothetical protein
MPSSHSFPAVIGAIVAAATLASCTLTISLDELGSGTEASSGAPGGGPSSAASSGGASGASTTTSATSASGGSGGAVGGCNRGAFTFCDDFDNRTREPALGWDVPPQMLPRSTVDIDDTTAWSRPHSLLVDYPANTNGVLMMTKNVAVGDRLQIEIDLRVPTVSIQAGNSCTIVYVQDPEGNDHGFYLSLDPGGGWGAAMPHWPRGPQMAPEPCGQATSSFPSDDAWHHFRFDIRFDSSAGGFDIYSDGESALSVRCTDTLGPVAPQALSLSVGILCSAGLSASTRLHFDDVKVY